MKINLLGSGVAGRSLPVTAQERVNMYVDVLPDGDKSKIVAYGMPGHVSRARQGTSPLVMLGWSSNSAGIGTAVYFMSCTSSPELFELASSYSTITNLGSVLPGSLVATPTNAAFAVCDITLEKLVTGIGYQSAGSIVSIIPAVSNATTGPVGANPTTIEYFADRFICNDALSPGKLWYSALQVGRSWPMGNAFIVEGVGNITRLKAWKDTLIVFGDRGTAFYSASDDLNQPYARIIGAKGDFGCTDPYSVAPVGDSLFFLASKDRGQRQFAILNGYSIQPIDVPDLVYTHDNALAYQSIDNAGAFSFGGHDFYWARPKGGYVAWVYDQTSGVWSTMSLGNRKLCSTIGASIGNALSVSIQNVILATLDDGNIVQLSADAYTYRDGNTNVAITRRLVLPHLYDSGDLNRIILCRFRLDSAGTGPAPTLSISRDGGTTYGTALVGAPLGNGREWRRLGQARDFTLKLEATGTTGPVAWVQAFADVEALNK